MNILITGAGKGIGFEVTKIFATQPNRIFAISRNCKQLIKLKDNNNCRAELIPYSYDLQQVFKEEVLFQAIKKHFNSIDIIINNAVCLINKPFNQTEIEEARHLFNVNFFAPARIISELLPQLSTSGCKHVVNIGSMGGFQGSAKFSGLSYYSASKAALASMTECLAAEFKSTPHRFNCLALGSIQTEMLEEAFPGYQAPLTPDEIAEFIVDFALRSGKFLNGKIIPVALSNP